MDRREESKPSLHGGSNYGKRKAEAEPKSDADAANYSKQSAPICHNVPQKMCNKVPVNKSRKVKKTVCKTVADIDIIEDCKEVITTHCE